MTRSPHRQHDVPIDRGWAWVITIVSCVLFAFSSGTEKCRGIMLVELIERFPDVPVTSLLWIFTLHKLISKCSGPINGLILAKTSHRFIAMTGVLLISTSLFIFGYLPRYEYMYPVYGIGFGPGVGMISLCAYTASAPYFNKKKSLAIGISTSGSGLGLLLVPPILRSLLDNFSFQEAFVLFSGICLQTIVLAALYRPISYYTRYGRGARKGDKMPLADSVKDCNKNIEELDGELEEREDDSVNQNVPSEKCTDEERLSDSANNTACSLTCEELQCNPEKGEEQVDNECLEEETHKNSFNWRLACSPQSVVMGICFFSFSSGILTAYQCLPPLAKYKGVSKEMMALLLSVGGGLEIPARLGMGWLADKRYITPSAQMAVNMCFVATGALLCAVLPGKYGVPIMAISLSSMGASAFSALPAVISDLMGKENVASALSINFFYEGLSAIFSTFISGGIYDLTGQWEHVFLFTSSCFYFSAIIMIGITIKSYRNLRQAQLMESPDTVEMKLE